MPNSIDLFLDTNIIIDLVANRKPFSKWAYKIFEDQKSGRWKIWTSGNSILTTYYILEKEIGILKARKAILILLQRVNIQPIDKSILQLGFESDFKDCEDGVQFICARSIKKIKYIITRNKKDFKKSTIEVLSSEELYI